MCRFRAIEMLELRRAIAADPTLTHAQIGLVIAIIDQARHEHLESTRCNCWQEAINALASRNLQLPLGEVA